MCVQVYTVDIDNHTAVREAVYKSPAEEGSGAVHTL